MEGSPAAALLRQAEEPNDVWKAARSRAVCKKGGKNKKIYKKKKASAKRQQWVVLFLWEEQNRGR